MKKVMIFLSGVAVTAAVAAAAYCVLPLKRATPGARATVVLLRPDSAKAEARDLQLALLTSDAVLKEAARSLAASPLRSKLPEAEDQLMSRLARGLSLDRDPSLPADPASPVLQVQFLDADPALAVEVLQHVLAAMNTDLCNASEGMAVERLELLRTAIDRNQKINRENLKAKTEAMDTIASATNEDIALIRKRFSKMVESNQVMKQEMVERTKMLDMLKTAGAEKSAAVLRMMGLPADDATDKLRAAESVLESVRKSRGQDHPQAKAAEVQVEFLKAAKEFGNLTEQQSATFVAQYKLKTEMIRETLLMQESTIASDSATLKNVLPKQNIIETMDKVIADRNKLIDTYELERTTTDLSRAVNRRRLLVTQAPRPLS